MCAHFLNRIPAPQWYARSLFLAGWRTAHQRQGNADQHQRLLESGFRGVLTFCPYLNLSSIAPMERYTLDLCGLQGGGLYIEGTATLTNTNVYSNQASQVCSLLPLPRHFLQRPAEFTYRCARVCCGRR